MESQLPVGRSRTKSVLVVGAGPAGLVTAKNLLSSAGNFKVTIFESSARIGGMWAIRNGELGVKCSPEMPTNLSRFTVAFSDLSWTSVDLRDEPDEPHVQVPIFPKAWHVGRYLETYAKKYIPYNIVSFNRTVVNSKRELVNGSWRWTVQYKDEAIGDAQGSSVPIRSAVFDHVVVASGFFQNPGSLPLESPLPEQLPLYPAISSKIKHSTDFRSIQDLLAGPVNSTDEKSIVVVGGSLSGVEAAVAAAFQLSNATHSPGEVPAWANSKVYHVSNRPVYCLPRYLPCVATPGRPPTFMPLDLSLYDLGGRLAFQDPVIPSNGKKSPEQARAAHEKLRSIVGEQPKVSSIQLTFTQRQRDLPVATAIADSYYQFVQSGHIIPHRGRAVDLECDDLQDREAPLTMAVRPRPPWDIGLLDFDNVGINTAHTLVTDIVGVINATGFRPCIPWLPDDVSVALEGPRKDENGADTYLNRMPYLLHTCSTYNRQVPDLAFCGYYEGPFWGVIEMQARLIAKRWSALLETADEGDEKEVSELVDLRDAMRARDPTIPPFWMGDYVGIMEATARQLGITRDVATQLPESALKAGPVIPSRYATSDSETEEIQKATDDLSQAVGWSQPTDARFVPIVVFRCLQGPWQIWDAIQDLVYRGEAHFHPRQPTDPAYSAEYLCHHRTNYQDDNAPDPELEHWDVWRYSEVTNTITVWTVMDDCKSACELVGSVDISSSTTLTDSISHRTKHCWIARLPGYHLLNCEIQIKEFIFPFNGAFFSMFKAPAILSANAEKVEGALLYRRRFSYDEDWV